MKKNVIVLVAVLVFVSLLYMLFKTETPDQVFVKLIERINKGQDIDDLITKEDALILKEENDLLSLIPFDPKNFINISSSNTEEARSFLNANFKEEPKNLIIPLVKENGKWKVFLNLKMSKERNDTITEYARARNANDLDKIYSVLQRLVFFFPGDTYKNELENIKKQIYLRDLIDRSKNLIELEIKHKREEVIYGDILNNSEVAISYLTVLVEIIRNDSIFLEKEVVLLEKTSTLLNTPIKPNHRKKFGIDVKGLKNTDKIQLSVKDIEILL